MVQTRPDTADRGKLGKAALKDLYQRLAPLYEKSLQELQQRIRQLLEQQGFSPTIKYRVKRFEAYYEKLRRHSAEQLIFAESSLTDFLGIRIICPFLADIETVESLFSAQFEILEVERKAGQHSFREFGYDSVHLLINHAIEDIETPMPGTHPVCEIQLRTILQDAWAEVEHELVYKSDIDLPNESIRRKLASLNATLTLSDLIFQEIRDFQQELRYRGRKRRESVQSGWQPEQPDGATKSLPSLLPASALRLGPVPKTLTSELEKLMLLALEAHSNQEFQTAIELYGKLLGLKLKSRVRALVYNHRGMAYFAMGETRLAIKDFSKALSYDPGSIRGHINRGLCYRVLQQFEQALVDFDRALQLDNEHEEGYFGRAQCYFEMGLYDQALTDCNEILQRSPEHQPARHLRKLIHRTML
jgi:putative GTP pyrophosphokinase